MCRPPVGVGTGPLPEEAHVSDELLVDIDDGVMVLTINRPERRNALDLATAEALASALDELDGREDVRVGVLTGAGGSFCAGMDLKAFAESGQRPVTQSRGGLGIVRRPPVKPVVAAVEGFVLGGGFEVALACDLIVAAQDAVFGLPEVQRGLVAAGGGAMRLAQRLPHHLAVELLLTGTRLSAERAHQLGLVNRLAAPGEVLSTAVELARVVARSAPMAVAATKRIVLESPGWPADEAFARQEVITKVVRESEDAREGALAFSEKRPPVWKGR
ncbi:MAG: crotonase/enoyl-CoA hydratase family protein [Frankiales bacterium]|nr:crotonase/enoyl-CoA hydratase family protein [Frankiales bacterium]